MISFRILYILISVLLTFAAKAQSSRDYTSYHQTILMIEQWIAEEEFDQALLGYQALLKEYDRLLARDAFNACQLAVLRHHAKLDSFYYQCALAGVPEEVLKHNLHTTKARSHDVGHFDALFKTGHTAYLSRIDTTLRKEFIKRFNDEQQLKGKPRYKEEVTANFSRIRQLAKQSGFPGEQTIGVNNELEIGYVTATLLHYPYSYRMLEKEIEAGIRRGEIQPLGAAYIYGFNQTRTSVLYDDSVPVDNDYFSLSYNLPFGRFDSNTSAVDANRKQRWISSLKVHSDIERVARQYRIDYRLGY